jgi:hypothetical protein
MTTKKTLAAEEIATERPIGRRSAMSVATLGGLALLGLSSQACLGRGRTGCTDSDSGAGADGAGYGRHCSGCSDSDTSDASGHGVHCSTGCTDHDPTDGVGHGIHCV